MTQPLLEVFDDADALARRAADLMLAAACAKDGEVLAGDKRLPAARLQPHGRLHFLADRAAAGD